MKETKFSSIPFKKWELKTKIHFDLGYNRKGRLNIYSTKENSNFATELLDYLNSIKSSKVKDYTIIYSISRKQYDKNLEFIKEFFK